MQISPLMLVLCAAFATCSATAYTQELYNPSTRDLATQLLETIYDRDADKTVVSLNSGAPVNIQIGSNKETPLIIGLKRLKDLKKYKKKAGYVSLIPAGTSAIVGLVAYALSEGSYYGSSAKLEDVVKNIIVPCLWVGCAASVVTALVSLYIYLYTGSVTQLARVIKELIKHPATDISIKNAENKKALDIVYEILAECGPSQDIQEIERLLVYKASLKK